MMQCERCMATETEENRILSEIAHSRNRSLGDLLNQTQNGKSSLMERAGRFSRERLEEKVKKQAESERRLRQYEEQLSHRIVEQIFQQQDSDEIAERVLQDKRREELAEEFRRLQYQPDGISRQDLENSLEEYIKRGEIEVVEGTLKITPRGARKLANWVLARILGNLAGQQQGPHSVEETGYGVERAISSRRYEPGDQYDRIDFEKTFLNALEKHPQGRSGIKLEPDNFRIYEEIHQTRMIAGLIIDESGSMVRDKANAALDTALALAELVRRERKDLLKVYLFSEQVQEIPYYGILNATFPGGFTDIRAALMAFRKGIAREKGDKQAYLITDTEPNTEGDKYVGFDQAAAGVIQEVLRYREAGITLNIIMLDTSPKLRELASLLAKQNPGRVFFASPHNLGDVIIEDYLAHRRKTGGGS